jgi:hypothetical protein
METGLPTRIQPRSIETARDALVEINLWAAWALGDQRKNLTR